MPQTQEFPTLTIAEGSIDPATRVASNEITNESVQDFCERLLSDEFYTSLSAVIPTKCVDGRSRADANQELGANAAGGTTSLVIADALTHNSYRHADEKAPQHATRLFGELKKMGLPVGNHDDDHASGLNCGCGACDKLDNTDPNQPSILKYLAHRGEEMRNVIAGLGVEISDETHSLIMQNAQNLVTESYATNGSEMRQATKNIAGEHAIETLTGTHNEVAAVINTQSGTTLNRAQIREQFGDKIQAFNVDVWSLQEATKLISLSEKEAHEKFVAALYYNVATAAVLAGPSLRIVVR